MSLIRKNPQNPHEKQHAPTFFNELQIASSYKNKGCSYSAVGSAAAAEGPVHAGAHPELSCRLQRAVGPGFFHKAKRNRSCLLKILCFIFQKHKRKIPILLCLCSERIN